MTSPDTLRGRSIHTLAWLGDAEFERELRLRVAARGDHPTDRLDRVRARIARAETQAELLHTIEPGLDEAERALVRRARNASLRPSGRSHRNVRAYRAATALEALVAHWMLLGPPGRARFEALLVPPLEQAIDVALAGSRKPRRG